MKHKDLKINFRHLSGNIACLSVNSINGKIVHNDINNEEAIIIFNSLVGEKENCQTVKKLLEENEKLKEQNKKEFADYVKFKKEQYDEYLEKVNKLIKQNAELKRELEERPKEYVFIGNAQNKTRDFINQITKDNKKLLEENKKLKKQLEDMTDCRDIASGHRKEVQDRETRLLNQQKEFIDCLDNEINKIKEQIRTYDIWHEVGVDINFLILKKQFFIEILSKYKKIIGVGNEN